MIGIFNVKVKEMGAERVSDFDSLNDFLVTGSKTATMEE